MSQANSPMSDASATPPEQQDDRRGRDFSRESDRVDGANGVNGNAAGGNNGNGTPSGRKRRRSRKGLDKKYECPEEGCGKSYSRAEHLYRHQLNHTPKEIFYCNYPGCTKQFVRSDLQSRHMERHTSRQQQIGNNGAAATPAMPASVSPEVRSAAPHLPEAPAPSPGRTEETSVASPWIKPEPGLNSSFGEHQSPSTPDSLNSSFPPPPKRRKMSIGSKMHRVPSNPPPVPMARRGSIAEPMSGPPLTPVDPMPRRQSMAFPPPAISPGPYSIQPSYPPHISTAPPPAAIIPPALPGISQSPMTPYTSAYHDMDPMYLTTGENYQIFNTYETNSNPFDFYNSLMQAPDPSLYNSQKTFEWYEYQASPSPEAVAAHLHETRIPEKYQLSDEMYQEIVGVLSVSNPANWRVPIFAKDRLPEYIRLFFKNFYRQIPIIHKPTFVANNTNKHLLAAIVLVGAHAALASANPDKDTIEKSMLELTNASGSLRWDLFSDDGFQAPAKLHIFQALLLLEMFEKLCGSRSLHERAHIHHATTITLMRRGTSFVQDPISPEGAARERWWKEWINEESTKRTVFYALLLDASHAAMFGHNAALLVSDISTTLPCDERLWEANTADLAKKIFASEQKNIIPIHDAMRRFLHGYGLPYTSTFGRMAILAGILSIYLGTRGLKGTATAQSAIAGENEYDQFHSVQKREVRKALRAWKANFDDYIDSFGLPNVNTGTGTPENETMPKTVPDAVEEMKHPARDAWYCLAYMSLTVDVVQLQIIGGIESVLSRKLAPGQYEDAYRKMTGWATSEDARLAVWHALKLIRDTIYPEVQGGGRQLIPYSPFNDFVLCRPWAMYYAALTVWAWAFLPEGQQVSCPVDFKLWEDDYAAKQSVMYLDMTDVADSEQLAHMPTAERKSVIGLLVHLRKCFEKTHWDLLRFEAVNRLGICLSKMTGYEAPPDPAVEHKERENAAKAAAAKQAAEEKAAAAATAVAAAVG